ncbi:MAG: UDP-glucose/GDP-mannose dehydrogenase family protein [Gemmatales bacterium]|nr:UDP-glucose/GDP-mannose dehydrogenase family protein [Gemmatales bacterium]MDW7994276.1 UDP-glucose/GDP-mannose dehydrogenase family protein [Gemmatales bacterium]
MRVAVIGTGYVGLVTASCLAESGNDVTGMDVDEAKIARLRQGEVPIYEPGLEELVKHNLREERLRFSTDLRDAVQQAEVIFICVGTPARPDGHADLSSIWAVGDALAETISSQQLVVIKSTVPVGTNRQLLERMQRRAGRVFDVASNPEFLKEGAAVEDFMRPDRVVVGVRTERAARLLEQLHAPFLRAGQPFLVMSPESAEATKYVANALLATKISFINEMANLCERLGADINDVRRGIGYDKRIGFQFLHPGVGFGGSCFPKDLTALAVIARQHGLPLRIVEAVLEVNERQKRVLLEKMKRHYGSLAGKVIAVWGLSFKPRTDDIREAPALVLLDELLREGASCRVHDPAAMPAIRRIYGERLTYCDKPYTALQDADGLAIVTEWPEFRNPDFALMARLMRQKVIFDGRNLYEPRIVLEHGFCYYAIGRLIPPAPLPKERLASAS